METIPSYLVARGLVCCFSGDKNKKKSLISSSSSFAILQKVLIFVDFFEYVKIVYFRFVEVKRQSNFLIITHHATAAMGSCYVHNMSSAA